VHNVKEEERGKNHEKKSIT